MYLFRRLYNYCCMCQDCPKVIISRSLTPFLPTKKNKSFHVRDHSDPWFVLFQNFWHSIIFSFSFTMNYPCWSILSVAAVLLNFVKLPFRCLCVCARINAKHWSLVLMLISCRYISRTTFLRWNCHFKNNGNGEKMHPPAPFHMQRYYPSLPLFSCSPTHVSKLVFLVWYSPSEWGCNALCSVILLM